MMGPPLAPSDEGYLHGIYEAGWSCGTLLHGTTDVLRGRCRIFFAPFLREGAVQCALAHSRAVFSRHFFLHVVFPCSGAIH